MYFCFKRAVCYTLTVLLFICECWEVQCSGSSVVGRSEAMSSKDELKSLFVVARHSVRAPVFYPPQDEFLNPKNFPRGAGYLTRRGIDSSLRVGSIWKQWYPDLMTGNVREVWARSSESYRCSETAQAILQSIYSSENYYQPISVIVPPANRDKYTSSNGLSDEELFKCMDGHYGTQIKTVDGRQLTAADILALVEENLGLEKGKTNPYDMFIYLDADCCQLIGSLMTLNHVIRPGIESLHHENLDQSSWYKNNRDLIDPVYSTLYERIASSLRPYYGYFLLRGLANRMKLVKEGKAKYGDKWSLFLHHDFSMSAVFTCLDKGLERLKAEFLGGVFFEMYQRAKDRSYYFKLFWTKGLRPNGTYYDKEPINLKSMNGSNEIEFDDLWSRLYNNIFEEHMTNNKYALRGYTGEDAFI